VRRLRFAIRVARRDPRLLVDYLRLWLGARGAVPSDPGWAAMDADQSLAELAHSLVRERRPATVIETGVARGITSAAVLRALHENGFGELHSIDLPPPRMLDAGLVGSAVPEELKPRWHYHWGSAKRLLPAVLARSTGPRLFIHDSDHTYDHMRWEIETAWAALEPGDVILCDDAHFHPGFADAAGAVGAEPKFVDQPGGLTGMLTRS
jgi:predicted O-methyltransferase YrrM